MAMLGRAFDRRIDDGCEDAVEVKIQSFGIVAALLRY
jgi:hypothetical protein